jgi:RHS repeat-associated protein
MRGEKSYELANHMGNVMVVVSDKRLYNCSTSTYVADVMNANDYSPFGAPLAGRSWNQRIILDNRFAATTESWLPFAGSPVLTTDNGRLKITASNTASIEKKVVAEPGMVYELVFDMDAGTFSDLKIDVLESVASGKPVNTSYTTIRNGKHTIYFKAATNEIFLRFSPQTNLTGSRNAYINYITLRRVSSRPAPGSIVYTENMTLTSRTGNTPSTYTASNSITFDSGFESGTSDEFQTFVEPTIFVSDGMERDDYRFGFNGMEKDDETYGAGGEYNFGNRIYDSRLGKFLSIDSYAEYFTSYSPYNYCYNNPIRFIDIKGGFPGDINVIIVIDNFTGYANKGYPYEMFSTIGDWRIIRASSIEVAAAAMKVSFAGQKVDNIVLSGHGSGQYSSQSLLCTSAIKWIDPRDVQRFLDDRDGLANDNPSIYKELVALEQVSTFLNPQSNMVFALCGSGVNENLGVNLTRMITNATNFNQVNVLVSTDNVNYQKYYIAQPEMIQFPKFDVNLNNGKNTGFYKYTRFDDKIFKFHVGDLKLNQQKSTPVEYKTDPNATQCEIPECEY